MFTPFSDLNALLADLVASQREILGPTYVGTYLQGSFALGAGDVHSDCDFIVACTELPSGDREAGLRALHDELPTRPGRWSTEIEGSYADVESLRSVAGLGVPWLFNDHGTRTLVWDLHCNSPHARWILRHHGIVLDGPPITSLVDEVPASVLRSSMRAELPHVLDGIREWAPMGNAWSQRYIVSAYCRTLYTIHTGEVESKRGALVWAKKMLDQRWHPLIEQVLQDRDLGWDADAVPRPGSMEETLAFSVYAEGLRF
ncbi:aminoglycoside adenylyltransferase domain-containing protein [Lentzea sp. NPDC055074]